MKTMTLNLPEAEMAALDELAGEKDMSKTAVLRQALRLYQLVHIRTRDGWEIDFVDAQGRSHRQVMCPPLLGHTLLGSPNNRDVPTSGTNGESLTQK